jgi:outer membrane lipoprotein carrier protein
MTGSSSFASALRRAAPPAGPIGLLGLLLVLLVIPASVAAQDGSAVLAEVQERYDAVTSMEAAFTQTVTSPFRDDSTRLEGRLFVRGEMYRIETVEQTLITDGTTSWIYTPADSQVVVNDAASSKMALSPETFFADYAARYRVDSLRPAGPDADAEQILALTPSSPDAAFGSVTLWVRPDRVISRLQVTDSGGSTITIRLRTIRLNPTLARERFSFEPPPTVEVIDLRTDE